MPGERYVVLGLAHPRATWFRDLARWSTSGLVPLEFLKCVTPQEMTARLRAGRALSAVLLDGAIPGTDRDLIADARDHGCVVVVVGDVRRDCDWRALGAAAVLPLDFEPRDLIAVLDSHASMINRAVRTVDSAQASAPESVGRLVAVCSSGSAGSSTIAMALAQGLAIDRSEVLLADFALDADMALLHDVGDVIPSVRELVDAHRGGTPPVSESRSYCFELLDRNYHLLLGLRRHREWTTLRPRAFDAALTTLRRSFNYTVADVSSDLEGEAQCGSLDVEERNYVARATTAQADLVLAIGRPGVKGSHRLVRLIGTLLDHGVDAARLLPVVNCAPRSRTQRLELSAALAHLISRPDEQPTHAPVFVPEARRVDDAVRDGDRVPAALVSATVNAVVPMLDALEPSCALSALTEPVSVRPGSVGTWYESNETDS